MTWEAPAGPRRLPNRKPLDSTRAAWALRRAGEKESERRDGLLCSVAPRPTRQARCTCLATITCSRTCSRAHATAQQRESRTKGRRSGWREPSPAAIQDQPTPSLLPGPSRAPLLSPLRSRCFRTAHGARSLSHVRPEGTTASSPDSLSPPTPSHAGDQPRSGWGCKSPACVTRRPAGPRWASWHTGAARHWRGQTTPLRLPLY